MKSFLITCGIFFGMVLIYIAISLTKTENEFTYLIDDAYIHLAIAKNFALHHVWGITQHQLSSTSSSPLFTFILSVLISVFGNFSIISLVFNILAAFLLICVLNSYYSRELKNGKYVAIASVFTLLFAVMHLQVLLGMEHVFQVLIFAINISFFNRFFQAGFKDIKASVIFLGSLMLLGVIRFESMFYFAALSFLLVLLKNFSKAFAVLVFGFVPIAIFCYFNNQEFGYFFPNSLVVKGSKIDFNGDYIQQLGNILSNVFLNITFYKVALFPLLMVGAVTYSDFKAKLDTNSIFKKNCLLYVLTITIFLHGAFANFRGFYRYEAYLMVGFCMAFIPRVRIFFTDTFVFFKSNLFFSLLIIGNIVIMGYKCVFGHFIILNGGKDIFLQQVQSGKFLNKYYNNSKVVANDIGAICYLSDVKLFDFVGLGSPEAIPFNEDNKQFDQKYEDFLTKYCLENRYELAIVYDEWMGGHVPKSWDKVAILDIGPTIAAAYGHVSIYAIDGNGANKLRENIRKYNWDKRVKVTIAK